MIIIIKKINLFCFNINNESYKLKFKNREQKGKRKKIENRKKYKAKKIGKEIIKKERIILRR